MVDAIRNTAESSEIHRKPDRGKEERKGKGFPCRGHIQKGGELKGVGSLTCLREGGKRLARYTEIRS